MVSVLQMMRRHSFPTRGGVHSAPPQRKVLPREESAEVFIGLSKIFCSLIPLNGKKPAITGWERWCQPPASSTQTSSGAATAASHAAPPTASSLLTLMMSTAFEAMRTGRRVGTCRLRAPTRRAQASRTTSTSTPTDGRRYGYQSIKSADGKSVFDIRGSRWPGRCPGLSPPGHRQAIRPLSITGLLPKPPSGCSTLLFSPNPTGRRKPTPDQRSTGTAISTPCRQQSSGVDPEGGS